LSLISAMTVPGDWILEEQFYVLLESHLSFLRNHALTKITEVKLQQAEKYTGDFHGLLDTLAIDKKFHYLITRLNGLNCSTDYKGTNAFIIMPDTDTAADFISTYLSTES